MNVISASIVAATLLGTSGCGGFKARAKHETAPLLEGLGDHHFEITTSEKMAQRFFDQGLILYYGFNHLEAKRSFAEAARIDPECAMCPWGVALTLGTNINARMEAADVPEAFAAAQKALTLALGASPREQALIQALATRYEAHARDDRSQLDKAYSIAMRDVAQRFGNDPDVLTLYAESLMDLSPWDYWLPNNEPKPTTTEILATLESAIAVNPKHPGANHLYIHAVETGRPEAGVGAAERLATVVPGAGHLVHMPSHIYIRVGRYHDGSLANERAIAADRSYITQCRQQGLYPLAYVPHNVHFLWACETLEGRSADAIETAYQLNREVDTKVMRQPGYGTLQHFWITPLYALVRFGKWDEVLAYDEPEADLVYPRGVWHYARTLAHARKGNLDAAAADLERLWALADDPALEAITIWDINGTAALLGIARYVAAGELAAARGDHTRAVEHLRQATALEDALNYDEPSSWHAPVRHTLGAVLLQTGDADAAEAAYREDLNTFPNNGWALRGLQQSLRAQGKNAEAEALKPQLTTAWKYADIQLSASRY